MSDLEEEKDEEAKESEEEKKKKKTGKRARTSYAWAHVTEDGDFVKCEVTEFLFFFFYSFSFSLRLQVMLNSPLGVKVKCGKRIRFKHKGGSESLKVLCRVPLGRSTVQHVSEDDGGHSAGLLKRQNPCQDDREGVVRLYGAPEALKKKKMKAPLLGVLAFFEALFIFSRSRGFAQSVLILSY